MSDPINRYSDLIAWKKAFQLGITVHRMAGTLPDHERYGLVAQLRRVAADIATTIARGYGTGNTADYLWHLKHARGDLYKMDTLLLFALEFTYIDQQQHQPVKTDLDETERVLAGLIRSLGG